MRDDNLTEPPFDLIDADTKAWIDARASWIVHQFGHDRVRNCDVILPTDECFPNDYSGTEENVRAQLDRICEYLQLDSKIVDLSYFPEAKHVDDVRHAVGLYEQEGDRYRIWLKNSHLHAPLDLAATMAHELCHIHLLGHGRVTDEVDDHEPLTDLLTVFLGMGVITANSVLHDATWSSGGMDNFQISRTGYLTMPMYGYALALLANLRGQNKPAWRKHLRPDVLYAFRKSQRYFSRHGVPELNRVRMTDSRPTLVLADSREEKEQHREMLEVVDGQCIYCGALLADPYESQGACQDC